MIRLTIASGGESTSITPSESTISSDVAAHHRHEHQKPLDERRVGAGAGDELAGRHPVEVGEVQPLQMGVHLVAQVVLDCKRNAAATEASQVGEEQSSPRAIASSATSQGSKRRRTFDDDAVDDLAL